MRPDRSASEFLVWANLTVVYIVWGSTYLAILLMVKTIPPLLAGGVRFLVAGAIAYAWLAIRRGWAQMRVTRRELLACTFVGTALLLGGNGLVSIAEQEVPSGLAALMIASVPLWVVLLRFLARERVSGGTLLGVAIGFVGVALLVLPGDRPEGASLVGLLLLVGAASSWATGSFFSKRLPLPQDPFTSTVMQMLTGGVVLLVVGAARGEVSGFRPSEFSTESLLALLYLILIGSLLAFTSYTWLLQHAPISKVSTYAYVNPVIALFLGWWVRSEEITWIMIAGAALIIASVAFIVNKESRRPARAEVVESVPEGTLAPAEIR